MDKHKKAELPSKPDALRMALNYETWAKEAFEKDMLGSARQFELMALLLRYYGEEIDV
jgi:hypothetical protein